MGNVVSSEQLRLQQMLQVGLMASTFLADVSTNRLLRDKVHTDIEAGYSGQGVNESYCVQGRNLDPDSSSAFNKLGAPSLLSSPITDTVLIVQIGKRAKRSHERPLYSCSGS